MKIAIVAAWIAFAFITSGVTYGFLYGNGWAEVSQLWALPWGKVSFFDVYIGFALFSAWLIHREGSLSRSIVWIVLLLVLGNVISTLYVAIALMRSAGDWALFWNGRASPAIGR